ncbi:hypothetical protein [Streptomyces sp. NPDC048665]|uniref:hypothetical protein n=1 Tax=Streptomyces sp. NPDC048665 TaxID=3155490 RepID=UPI0034258116
MTKTTKPTAADGGTDVEILREGVPDGIPREDSELVENRFVENRPHSGKKVSNDGTTARELRS